jgi:hypothetical protein
VDLLDVDEVTLAVAGPNVHADHVAAPRTAVTGMSGRRNSAYARCHFGDNDEATKPPMGSKQSSETPVPRGDASVGCAAEMALASFDHALEIDQSVSGLHVIPN